MSGKTEAEGAATSFAMGTELCTLPIRVVNGSALGEGMSLVDCIGRYSPLTVHLGWDAFRLTQDADLAESSDYLVHLGIILFLHEDFRRRVRLFCQADTRLEGRHHSGKPNRQSLGGRPQDFMETVRAPLLRKSMRKILRFRLLECFQCGGLRLCTNNLGRCISSAILHRVFDVLTAELRDSNQDDEGKDAR